MRVGTEMVSLSGLKQQVKCYLATLNSLRLVNPDYAWIVKIFHLVWLLFEIVTQATIVREHNVGMPFW